MPVISAPAKQAALEILIFQLTEIQRFHPASYPLLAIHRLALDRCLDRDAEQCGTARYQQAAKYAHEICAGLDTILHPGHPVRAVQRTVLGRLMSICSENDQAANTINTSAACVVLEHAHKELELAFGREGILRDQIGAEIAQLRRDLAIRQQLH